MRHIGKPIVNNSLRYVTMSDILHNNNSGYVHCLRCARHPSVLAFTSTLAYGRLFRGATGSDEPWPAEQPPLAVFPDCTRQYGVDMWSAHRIPQLLALF
jgi:hypothetical protein